MERSGRARARSNRNSSGGSGIRSGGRHKGQGEPPSPPAGSSFSSDALAAEVPGLAVRQDSSRKSSNVMGFLAIGRPTRGPCRFLLSFERRSPKTCPLLRRAVGRLVRRRAEATPKDLCGGRGRSGSDRALPAAASPWLGGTPLVRGRFHERRRTGIEPAGQLFARPPVLKTGTLFPGRGAIEETR